MKRGLTARPDFALERARLALGDHFVAGVDEVGRGPLAGPVTAAAVILDADAIPEGLDDSKKLSPARREALTKAILESALAVAVACVDAGEIDALNIRRATLLAMARALAALSVRPDFALIDGRDIPPGAIAAAAVIGGDGKSQSIAAASIVAKTTRDRLMANAERFYPGYGFASHAGYPTRGHREAILQLGLSPLHRRSFTVSAPRPRV